MRLVLPERFFVVSILTDKLDLATPKIVTSKSGTKFYKKLKLQTSGLVGS
ncbi:hypothetical protein F442_02998 [Phytophthora nicotianae P10297]|uniref:Uncharacterized protein n=2 Tax=Phytophthora nicotianae TaxID=4792 RepID=W3A073_PHYNI|nr:hypothetical protein F444_03067 [Phytophthora nicotianae P1976]ETP51919.1 hypothetical protein F442_02998 [Phytophthora nicotianae P10297]